MDIYIADDLVTDQSDAALSARQGMLLGQRVTALEQASTEIATNTEIDAIFS